MHMTTHIFSRPFVIALAVGYRAACAAVVPVSPIGGETVALLPEEQKKIMSFATYEQRLAALKADKAKSHDARFYCKDRETKWRISAPLVLEMADHGRRKGALEDIDRHFAGFRQRQGTVAQSRGKAQDGDVGRQFDEREGARQYPLLHV